MNGLRMLLSFAFAGAGLYGVYLMYSAEVKTVSPDFSHYFPWALGAGIVFLSIGAALTAFEGKEDLITDYDDVAEK